MRLIRNRIILKAFAVFFILETLTSTVLPTISWALTAGPTAPEATSFEPVDTTDMVNLATGDLAYNLPLLEVPGPSGGYPLSLSYHAGIMPNEEASWVGLGWTLNPGAINRSISGFADDHKDAIDVDRFYWSGGETHTVDVGVTLGVGGAGAASAGLSFSQDTYQGFGVGVSVGVGWQWETGGGGNVGVNASVGVDPYGNPFASAGASIGLEKGEDGAVNLSVGVGLSTNFKSVASYAGGGVSVDYKATKGSGKKSNEGIQAGSASLLGASISSSSSRYVNVSIGGISQVNNGKAGKVSTSSWGVSLPIPFVNIGYRHQRYWIDQTEKVSVNGSLYNPTGQVSGGFDKKAYDGYTLMDPRLDLVAYDDPEKFVGGSFLNYDNYSVNAQGIGGSIRPYSFKNLIFRQNQKHDGKYKVKQFTYTDGYNADPIEFRFVGDFSNRYENNGGFLALSSQGAPLVPTFQQEEQTGDPDDSETGTGIFDGHLPGSQHIEWYTNNQILDIDNTKDPQGEGFMNCNATGFTRANTGTLKDQIGGFKITNASGVTYHFSLPAYAYNEYQRSENIEDDNGEIFNELSKREPYAYTWYLTAITGPDFVDRGVAGKLDAEDWGYWVEFEYGKWTDHYAWRNPSEGMTPDIDNNFKNFSQGLKELYYLDAIRTKTHTALFAKSIRHDAKGIAYTLRNSFGIVTEDKEALVHKIHSSDRQGGFIPREVTSKCEIRDMTDLPAIDDKDKGSITYVNKPTSSLKLDSIYLIRNEDLQSFTFNKSNGMQYQQGYSATWNVSTNHSSPGDIECDFSPLNFNQHLYQNVFDVYDVAAIANQNLRKKSIRVIGFKNSNTLAPETENSFDAALLAGGTPSTESDDYTRYGKLTLDGIQFKGKGGANLLPPMNFEYDLDNPIHGRGGVSSNGMGSTGKYQLLSPNSGLIEGDIIKFPGQDGHMCYAVVYDMSGSWPRIHVLGKVMPVNNQSVLWEQTKNPPYNKDQYDSWGMYKSDYLVRSEATNESVDRMVTTCSSRGVDAWSLRRVQTSTGSYVQIDYEPDQYQQVAMSMQQLLRIKKVDDVGNNQLEIFFHEQTDLDEFFQNVPSVSAILVGYETLETCDVDLKWTGDCSIWDIPTNEPVYIPAFRSESSQIVEIRSGSIVIEDAALVSKLNGPKTFERNLASKCFDIAHETEVQIEANGWPQYISGGVITFPRAVARKGGGVNVKAVSVVGLTSKSTTSYDYSGGTTSYEPYEFLPVILADDLPNSWYDNKAIVNNIKREITSLYKDQLAYAREIPPPGVVYQNVTVREFYNGNELPNRSVYEFQVFHEDDIGITTKQELQHRYTDARTYDGVEYKRMKMRDLELKDFTARVGSLKRITLLDAAGHKVNETINHYLHDNVTGSTFSEKAVHYAYDLEDYNSQGVIQETFMDARFVKLKENEFDEQSKRFLMATVSRKHYYPSIQTGQTVINYSSGITTETKNLAFDFYSGRAIKVYATDGFGNGYVTETTPAHKKYTGMGLTAQGGRNMLDQDAATMTYKVSDALGQNKTGFVSGSIQTWSDQLPVLKPGESLGEALPQADIWRKHSAYVFVGDDNIALQPDGLYPVASVSDFTDWAGNNPEEGGWQRTGAITLYDAQSHALEATDLNDDFAATRMSFDQTHVMATVANAAYHEFAYSGAEELPAASAFGDDVVQNGTPSTETAHTGKKSIRSQPGSRAFTYTFIPNDDRKWKVSVWSSEPYGEVAYNTNGGIQYSQVKHIGQSGDWHLLEADIDAYAGQEYEIWCGAQETVTFFDDFRICPFNAAMSSYVYNEWDELTHILDNQNLYSEYRYDGMGKLTETYKETFQRDYGNEGIAKISEVMYNYGRSNPFLITMTASSTGSTGTLTPTGSTTVEWGGSIDYTFNKSCPDLNTLSIQIDGKPYTFWNGNTVVTLSDGTKARLTDGKVTFSNVQSSHNLQVQFATPSGGVVSCYSPTNEPECYNGSYQYALYDNCGHLGPYHIVNTWQQVPAAIRGSSAPTDCCSESYCQTPCTPGY